MFFSVDKETTLDNSVHIFVSSISKNKEEYIFQFALNKHEIRRLRHALKKAEKILED